MIFKQVTFVSTNNKCVSLPIVRYNIDTLDTDLAKRKAVSLLNNKQYADKYRLLSIIDVVLHPCS